MSRRRLGIMGGTFDPIHHGHLVAASEVQARLGLDEVVFVPTGIPWQKGEREVSPAEDRYLMTVVGTASNPRFSTSRVDVDRRAPTVTVDTLTDLRTEFSDHEMFFITGADALAQILSWKRVDELFDLAHLVGVTRPGFPLVDAHLPARAVSLIEVPAMAISSTDCRQRVAGGLPVWYMIPDGVVQYITKRGLYRIGQRERTSTPALTQRLVSYDSGMSSDHVIVVSTTDSEESARVLAAGAIEAKLGACAQVVGPITSVFRWEGKVQTEQEWRVEIKTAADRVAALTEHLKANHSYDVPEIIATPITGGSAEYLSWLVDETRG